MVFLTGPRQIGKTTASKLEATYYLDWDHLKHRSLISAGPDRVAEHCHLSELREKPAVIVFDEIHKFSMWKTFLKGFFDTYGDRCRMIVTGSSKLDVFQKGGDSLMGRYFPYRMHPLSVGELLHPDIPQNLIHTPSPTDDKLWNALWTHGGFPEPLTKSDERFSRRWRSTRNRQLFKEEIRDLTRIRELSQLELLGALLEQRSGDQLVTTSLAQEIRVAPNTVKAWIDTFTALHYAFLVKPWFRNVNKALRKEPKWFLRDWAAVEDPGKRAETMMACHLLKAVEGWTDLGMGTFELRYIRDQQKREVDFLITQNGEPWFLVEVKLTSKKLSEHLRYFQKATGAKHAFQAVFESDHVNADCFNHTSPMVVPARTFLSQLL